MMLFGKGKNLQRRCRVGCKGLVDIRRFSVRQNGFCKGKVCFGIGRRKHKQNVALLANFIDGLALLRAEFLTPLLGGETVRIVFGGIGVGERIIKLQIFGRRLYPARIIVGVPSIDPIVDKSDFFHGFPLPSAYSPFCRSSSCDAAAEAYNRSSSFALSRT